MAAIDLPPLRTRLMVYEPDGALRGQLPVPVNWQMAVGLNTLSSMTLEYISGAPGVDKLAAPCEIALEIAGADGVFFEPPDCRFINIRMSQDRTQPDVTTKLTMPSYGWLMNKGLNIIYEYFNENGNRQFNTYPANIVKTFIDDAHGRGNINNLYYTFTETHDSAGAAWTSPLNIAITACQSIFTTLDIFASQGLFDWRMNARDLELYRPDTYLNRFKLLDPVAIKLQPNRDVSASPDDISWEDLVGRALVQGDDYNFITTFNFDNDAPWGVWEGFMTQGGIVDLESMTVLGERYLQTGNTKRTQITREIMFTYNSPLPFKDYRPGDHILAQDETSAFDDLRVRQITLTMQNGFLSGNVVLGDKFVERDLRFQRRLFLLGGSGTSGGSGTPPTKFGIDISKPASTAIGLSGTAYVDRNGEPSGIITVSWAPVTEDVDGKTQRVSSYRVQWAPTTAPDGTWFTRTVDSAATTTQIGEEVQAASSYRVRVAAVANNGMQGDYSPAVVVSTGVSPAVPSVPSAPVITTRLGTLRVHWNGLDSGNLDMPATFATNEVGMASAAAGPFSVIGTISSSRSDLIVLERPYDVATYFRMRAQDAAGNYSAYSAVASGIPTKAGLADIVAHSITSDLIEVGGINAESIKAYSLDVTRLSIGGPRNIIADPNLADTDLAAIRIGNANTNPNSAASLTWSYETNSMYRVKLNTASTSAIGRVGFHASSASSPNLGSGTSIAPNLLYPVDRNMGTISLRMGINISLSSGTWPVGATVKLNTFLRPYRKDGTATTLLAMNSQTFTAVTGGFINLQAVGLPIPDDAVSVIPYARVEFTNCTTAVNVDLSSPFAAQANPGVLIEDGAITANKIAVGSIEADKIAANAITTIQLDADAITSKHTIIGAVFMTAVSGPRVVISNSANYLNQVGIEFYPGDTNSNRASMFQTDTAGTGGWTPEGLVILGPQPDSLPGRAVFQIKPLGGFAVEKLNVNPSTGLAGIEAATGQTNNELLLSGTIPRGTQLNDTYGAIRCFTTSVATGGLTWALNNGWVYQGSCSPNSPSGTARYASIVATTGTSISWQSSGTVDLLYFMLFRGGMLY